MEFNKGFRFSFRGQRYKLKRTTGIGGNNSGHLSYLVKGKEYLEPWVKQLLIGDSRRVK